MEQNNADTVIMLSSELIAEVMEQYFNKAMFKKKVKIVDLQPTETGYAFSLTFVQSERKEQSFIGEISKRVNDLYSKREDAALQDILHSNRPISYTAKLDTDFIKQFEDESKSTRDDKGRFIKKDSHVTTNP